MMFIDTTIYLRVQECEAAPPPFPLKNGFSANRAYRALGGFTMSESAEMYFMLANDEDEIWFISNRHLRVLGDPVKPLRKGLADVI